MALQFKKGCLDFPEIVDRNSTAHAACCEHLAIVVEGNGGKLLLGADGLYHPTYRICNRYLR